MEKTLKLEPTFSLSETPGEADGEKMATSESKDQMWKMLGSVECNFTHKSCYSDKKKLNLNYSSN
jgi:hypothetical protein